MWCMRTFAWCALFFSGAPFRLTCISNHVNFLVEKIIRKKNAKIGRKHFAMIISYAVEWVEQHGNDAGEKYHIQQQEEKSGS